jgi:hypothetical protein
MKAKTKRHPGTIEARGDSLRVILYAAGQRYTFTLPTRDRREAVEFARKKHLELQHAISVYIGDCRAGSRSRPCSKSSRPSAFRTWRQTPGRRTA